MLGQPILKVITNWSLLTFFCSFSLFSQTISDVLDIAVPSVVTVAVYKNDYGKKMLGYRGEKISDQAYEKVLNLQGAKSSGSGFIIEKNGVKYVITNAHVIESASQEAGSICAFSINRSQYEMKLIGGDSFYDISVLGFVTPPGNEITALNFSHSPCRLGEKVYAIGNPLGEYPYSVSDGIISAKNRVRGGATGKFGFLQTTATVIWGNSGGPLINEKGEVVGINSQIAFANTPDGNYIWQSQINFALESDLAERLINDILTNKGLVRRAYIGLEIAVRYQLNYNGNEASARELDSIPVIMNVIPGSPAEESLSIYLGYSVLSINGTETHSIEEVLGEFEKLIPGTKVKIMLKKDNLLKTVEVSSSLLSEKELESLGRFFLDRNKEIEPDYNSPYVAFQILSQNGSSYFPDGINSKKMMESGNKKESISPASKYILIAAGIAGEEHENMWMVHNLKDFGAIVKIAAIQGVIDFYATQRGESSENIPVFRQFISGDRSIIQQTVFY
jgi:S1-C subfamily serine protease